jgi:hypothetical protein
MATWDFPLFYSNKFSSYPANIAGAGGTTPTKLTRGYSVDWVWNAPTTIVSIIQDGSPNGPNGPGNPALEYSGYSTSGGLPGSWTKFANPASKIVGGCIAATSLSKIVWTSTNSGANVPQFTTDGGTTWASVRIPGGTPTQGWGPAANYSASSKMCESDKATGDIYLYNVNDGSVGDQFYKQDATTGAWSTQSHPNFSNAYINEQMKSSGVAQNLFFTTGAWSGPHPQSASLFYYTTDGWVTKHIVNGLKEVTSFGFGATFEGQSYPTLYAAGWFTGSAIFNGRAIRVADAYGVWMCKGFNTKTGTCGTTWIQLGESYPMGIVATVVDMDGDKVTPGIVYVFTNGGAFWGRFN